MKITKRQLRRIIKEEKAKLIAEANDGDTERLKQAVRAAMEAGFMKSVLMKIVESEVDLWEDENPTHKHVNYTFASKDRWTK